MEGRLSLGILATLAFLALLPAAAMARTVTCGEVITQNTAVDNDLDCTESRGLVIGANGVRLDLRGHAIRTHADPLANSGFTAIDAQGHDDVVIRDGTASGSGLFPGVWVSGARNHIVDLQASGEWAFTVHGSDNVLRRVSGPQLLLSGENATVSSSHGMFALVSGSGHRIARNELSAAFIAASQVTVAHNQVARVRIEGDGNRIVHNRGVTTLGLSGADGNFVAHNQVAGPNVFGEVPGIWVGLDVPATGNAIVDNVVTAVADSFFPGIWVAAGSTGTQLLRNRSESNPGDGILVEEPGTLVRRNTANHNGELGIEAVPGVTDGGGNRATGNGDPRQCVGVTCR